MDNTRGPLNAAVSLELKGYLSAAGKTQAQLSKLTGRSQGVIQRYLAGDRDISVKDIAQFAEALGFEPNELMARAEASLRKR